MASQEKILKYFYSAMAVLFFGSASGNIYSYYLLHHTINLGQKLSSISSIIMNLVLFGFFIVLLKTLPKPQVTEKDMDTMLKEIKEKKTI